VLVTDNVKSLKTDPPKPSSAVTFIDRSSTFKGVPEKVLVAGSKVSQAGKSFPFDKLAV